MVNADGTVSGELTTVISDNITQNFGFLDDFWQIQTPLEVINITMDSRSACSASGVKFYVASGEYIGLEYANIRLDIADSAHSVYGYGEVSGFSDIEGDSYIEIENLVLYAKSGNDSDCAYLDTVNSGAIAFASNNYSESLGSLDFPIGILQLANIPPAERIHYGLYNQIRANSEYQENDRYPETAQCDDILSDQKFDVLNDRQLMPGEFLSLVSDLEEISVHRLETAWETSCNFTNIPLTALSRVLPEDTEEPSLDPSGRWTISSDGLSWDYLAENYSPDDSENPVMEINMDGVYTPEEMQAIIFALETGYQTNMTIAGVVFSTNGDFNAAKNSVSWNTAGIWGGSPSITIPGGADMRQPSINVLVGHSVSFKANKATWSNATTFGGLKAKLASLKSASIDTIQIIGIKKIGLSGAAATANQKLVQKRVTAIKNKLNAAKVKADIEIVYLTPNSVDGGDSKYANKVVVQTITN
jgi:hypothetical protein